MNTNNICFCKENKQTNRTSFNNILMNSAAGLSFKCVLIGGYFTTSNLESRTRFRFYYVREDVFIVKNNIEKSRLQSENTALPRVRICVNYMQ